MQCTECTLSVCTGRGEIVECAVEIVESAVCNIVHCALGGPLFTQIACWLQGDRGRSRITGAAASQCVTPRGVRQFGGL